MVQIPFLSMLKAMGDIRTLFAAEVQSSMNIALYRWAMHYLIVRCSCSETSGTFVAPTQLLLKCETRHFAQGSLIADSREEAKGLIVITSGQVWNIPIQQRINYVRTQFGGTDMDY